MGSITYLPIKMNTNAVLLLSDALRPVLEGLCKYPEREFLDIRCTPTLGRNLIEVHPHIADYPKLIGGAGVVVKAFQHICKQVGLENGLNIEFVLKEHPIKGTPEKGQPLASDPFFDIVPVMELVAQLYSMLTGGVPAKKFSCVDSGYTKSIQIIPSHPQSITGETLDALNHIFYAYGKAKRAGRIVIECQGVRVPSQIL